MAWDLFLAESFFSMSTASREMFLRLWLRKNQANIKMKQPSKMRQIFIDVGHEVAKRIKTLTMPRQIVYK